MRAELGEHERRPLVLGKALDVGEQVAQVLAALDLRGQAGGRGLDVLEPGCSRRARSIDRQRLRAIA